MSDPLAKAQEPQHEKKKCTGTCANCLSKKAAKKLKNSLKLVLKTSE